MRVFIIYVSYEVLVMYLVTALLYVGATAAVVAVLFARGEVLAASMVAPFVAVSWVGLFGQVGVVAGASSDMRRYQRGN